MVGNFTTKGGRGGGRRSPQRGWDGEGVLVGGRAFPPLGGEPTTDGVGRDVVATLAHCSACSAVKEARLDVECVWSRHEHGQERRTAHARVRRKKETDETKAREEGKAENGSGTTG